MPMVLDVQKPFTNVMGRCPQTFAYIVSMFMISTEFVFNKQTQT